jgi:predicted DNA-binding protein
MGKTVSVRLPDDVADKLEQLSGEINQSKTFLIKSAIEKYLSEYADYQVALDRLRDQDDRIISTDEVRDMLEI